MGFFSKFEGKMEDTFEGAAGKMQKSPISPVQIMKKAEKQMRREKVVSSGKQFAPTLYTVLVNPDDDQRLFGFYPTLAGECETRLAASAANEGLSMDGHPLVRFIVDDGLRHGKFDVIAEVVSAPIVAQLRAEEMQRYGMGGAAPAHAQQPAPYNNPAAAPQQPQQPMGRHAAPQHAAQPQQSAVVNDPFEPAADYGQQIFGAPEQAAPMGAGAAMGAAANAGAFPVMQEQPQVKPPLPYVPEDEIDYSIDYGEYTFDSKNFEDYRKPAGQTPDAAGNDAPEAPHGAEAVPAEIPAVPQAADPRPMANPAYPQGVNPAYPMGVQPSYGAAQPQAYGAYPNPAAYGAPAGAAPAQPAYGAPAATTVFAAGAAQANPIANVAVVRARLIDVKSNRSYDLATNRVLIGRETGNDIVLGDLNVSRQHAQVAYEPQGTWVITDLGSTNGTFVNGMPVTRRGLADGDRIILGVTEFVFSMR